MGSGSVDTSEGGSAAVSLLLFIDPSFFSVGPSRPGPVPVDGPCSEARSGGGLIEGDVPASLEDG